MADDRNYDVFTPEHGDLVDVVHTLKQVVVVKDDAIRRVESPRAGRL